MRDHPSPDASESCPTPSQHTKATRGPVPSGEHRPGPAPVIARIPSLSAHEVEPETEAVSPRNGRLIGSAMSLKLFAGAGAVLFIIAMCSFLFDKKDDQAASPEPATFVKEPFTREGPAPTAPTAPRWNKPGEPANWQASGATAAAPASGPQRVEIPASDETGPMQAAQSRPSAGWPAASPAGRTSNSTDDRASTPNADWRNQAYPTTDEMAGRPVAEMAGRPVAWQDTGRARSPEAVEQSTAARPVATRPEFIPGAGRPVSYDDPAPVSSAAPASYDSYRNPPSRQSYDNPPSRQAYDPSGPARSYNEPAPQPRGDIGRDDRTSLPYRPEAAPAEYQPRPRSIPAAEPEYRSAQRYEAAPDAQRDYRSAARPAPYRQTPNYETREYAPRGYDSPSSDAPSNDVPGDRGARSYQAPSNTRDSYPSMGQNFPTRASASPTASQPQSAAWPATNTSSTAPGMPQFAPEYAPVPQGAAPRYDETNQRTSSPSTNYDRSRPSLY